MLAANRGVRNAFDDMHDSSCDKRNTNQFVRYLSYFCRDEDSTVADALNARIKERDAYLDEIRGCIFGGAVGDALGYPIEF